MAEETDATAGVLKSGWWKGLSKLALFFAAFVAARWAGLIAVILLLAMFAVHWALKRWQPAIAPREREILTVHWGYALGMCVGLAAPGGLVQVGLDIVLIAAMAFWFWRRRSIAPLAILIAYHLAAIGVIWIDLAAPTFRPAAALVHTAVRVFAVVVMAMYLWERRNSNRVEKPLI
jgi:hypothetical protein